MRKIFIFLSFILLQLVASAQVNIVNALYTSYNISPSSVLQLNILNHQTDAVQVVVESVVYNSNNQAIMTVKTMPIWLKPGLNSLANQNISLASVRYAPTKQAEYVQNTKRMPSGLYRFCSNIYGVKNTEALDYACEDIQADFTNFLILAHPMDKDSITVKNPLLVWNHSEPFDVLMPGEYYRLMLVELKDNQTPEDGLNMNKPLFMKDFLSAHQVQYPVDAPELKPGFHYGWQVQKVTNSLITNKSEAWEFVVPKPKEVVHQKYAALQRQLNASFTTITSRRLYFHFVEEYETNQALKCKIYATDQNMYEPSSGQTIVNIDEVQETALKKEGQGRFMIDLAALNLTPDKYYTLQAENEKGEKFYLKFYVSPSAW